MSAGLYSRYILPRLIHLAMKNPEATRLRAAWIPQARGAVLEVGVGSGLNLPFYSKQVDRILAVDPSLELQRIARRQPVPVPLDFLAQSIEQPLPLADASIDTAVLTWTLCSIPNPQAALHEIRRVLKPAGRLIFVEHGHAPDAAVARWQDRFTPIWRRAAGGCHLNRPTAGLIRQAGFHIPELVTGYIRGPRMMSYTYQGIAQTGM